ncbi:MAG: Gfo/Idh/MocA family oxidoreductase [Bacteroidetes bacterium]|nr:Gfo/Idh/MocA family oxidoreductase [Bacteroidota bacterium]
MDSRRKFIQKAALSSAGVLLGAMGASAASYRRILGSNDRIRVGIIGFSDRFKGALLPSFAAVSEKQNFTITALSDIWRLRREEGKSIIREKTGTEVSVYSNNEALYADGKIDAVIISTADFQHAVHVTEAVQAGCDAYVEKPFAETMEDNRNALKAINDSGKIVQVGSQRRSGSNYKAAAEFVQSGKFGPITMVELTWNVNQPGRWRRLDAVARMKEEDTDWKRYLLNRPFEPFNARKHLEFRLFWPYSSGLPGQWMSHQIDTVHWFSGLNHPRSVTANGGVYWWKDGRENWDTLTAVFEYGPVNDQASGFQVTFSSRMHNGDENPKEIYFSNGGEMNLNTNRVSSAGGLQLSHAKPMGMGANLLPEIDLGQVARVETAANTGGDYLTTSHMLNWMECVRNRTKPNASAEAGYAHAVACIMTTAAIRTGQKATFDSVKQEIMAGGKVFHL